MKKGLPAKFSDFCLQVCTKRRNFVRRICQRNNQTKRTVWHGICRTLTDKH